MKHKIGEIIKITNDFEIKSALGGYIKQVKKGDTGFIDSKGSIHYLTGEARDKIQKIDDIELKGYDYESITNLIYKRLNCEFDIDNMLDDSDIDEVEHFKDIIKDVLSEIL